MTCRTPTNSATPPTEVVERSSRRTGGAPHATHPFGHVISLDGLLTEANGFNCTQGPSAYRTPCLTRKAGVAHVRHRPLGRRGHPRPLFLNLISRSFPKLAHAGPRDAARVRGGGELTVYRYRNGTRR